MLKLTIIQVYITRSSSLGYAMGTKLKHVKFLFSVYNSYTLIHSKIYIYTYYRYRVDEQKTVNYLLKCELKCCHLY